MENGADYEEARKESNKIAAKNAALLALTNPAQFGILSQIGKVKNRAKYIPMMGAEVGTQTFEEGAQEGFQLAAENKPNTLDPFKWYSDPQYNRQKEAAEYQNFFEGMFYRNGDFKNTEENRKKNS